MSAFRVTISVVMVVLVLATSCAEAGVFNCGACVPPTGQLGYVWFTLPGPPGPNSFTCQTGSQPPITQSYTSAEVGFKPDGTLAAIWFSQSGSVQEILITGSTVCTIRA